MSNERAVAAALEKRAQHHIDRERAHRRKETLEAIRFLAEGGVDAELLELTVHLVEAAIARAQAHERRRCVAILEDLIEQHRATEKRPGELAHDVTLHYGARLALESAREIVDRTLGSDGPMKVTRG